MVRSCVIVGIFLKFHATIPNTSVYLLSAQGSWAIALCTPGRCVQGEARHHLSLPPLSPQVGGVLLGVGVPLLVGLPPPLLLVRHP
jgi:hypothetical protein